MSDAIYTYDHETRQRVADNVNRVRQLNKLIQTHHDAAIKWYDIGEIAKANHEFNEASRYLTMLNSTHREIALTLGYDI